MSILSNRLKYILSPQADIYKKLSSIVSGKIADVGCGLGFGSNLLFKSPNIVYGFDINYLDFARWSFPNIVFNNHNIVEKRLPTLFNFIIMIDVIEHIEKDYKAINNCYNSLLNKGKLIFSTPNKLSRYRKSENHIREYSINDLKKLLNKSNFMLNYRILNYNLESASKYDNPLIAICEK